MGYWILAALVLLGYSGYKMMILVDPVIPIPSREVKGTRQNIHKMESLASLSAKGMEDSLQLDRVLQGFAGESERKTVAMNTPEKKPAEQKHKEPDPPDVSGIFQTLTPQGGIEHRALIKGSCVRENDSVNGFTVKEITWEGVTFCKNDKKWFMPSPDVDYSLDKGL